MSLASQLNLAFARIAAEVKFLTAEINALKSSSNNGSPARKEVWATATPLGIQEALNQCTEADPKIIRIPAGTYDLSTLPAKKLVIPQASRSIVQGESYGSTHLIGTPGYPLIEMPHPLTHSWTFSDMHLYYNDQQTSLVPAIRAGGVVQDEQGSFHNIFRDMRVEKAGVLFGLSKNAGKQTSWDILFENMRAEAIYNHVLDFQPQDPIGVPIIRWEGGSVMNHGRMPSSGYVGGPAFNLMSTEFFLDGLDIEGWHGPLWMCMGGSIVTLRSMHIEHHRLHTDQYFGYQANAPAVILGASISGATVDGSPAFFRTEANGFIDAGGMTMVWEGSTDREILAGSGIVRLSVAWPYGGGFLRGSAPHEALAYPGSQPLQGTSMLTDPAALNTALDAGMSGQ